MGVTASVLRGCGVVTLTGLASCITPGPAVAPPPAVPREAKTVGASFGETWNAVIERFAEDNIAIRTLERASGFIATEPMHVPAYMNAAADWADCGSAPFAGRLYPNSTSFNILVRGDTTKSTVKASIRWTTTIGTGAYAQPFECTSTGNWEAMLEEGIAARAENREAKDTPLRSLVPRPDTMPVTIVDATNTVWRVKQVPGAAFQSAGLEFWASHGEVRKADGVYTGWQSMPPAQLLDILGKAKVIQKRRR